MSGQELASAEQVDTVPGTFVPAEADAAPFGRIRHLERKESLE